MSSTILAEPVFDIKATAAKSEDGDMVCNIIYTRTVGEHGLLTMDRC
jgi:hypothetical protein